MGFRGGVKLTPPPHILVFKYPSRDRVKLEKSVLQVKPRADALQHFKIEVV